MIRLNLKVNITPEQLEEIAEELRTQAKECHANSVELGTKNSVIHSRLSVEKGQSITFVWKP